MTSAVTVLGWKPIRIQPILSMGQDWEVTITPTSNNTVEPVWPAGATIIAYVYDPDTDVSLPIAQWPQLYAWPGTITDDNVSFKGPFAQSDLVPANALMRIRVVFPNTPAADHYTWAAGTVKRND